MALRSGDVPEGCRGMLADNKAVVGHFLVPAAPSSAELNHETPK
jgi:hypothetical protein